MQVARSVKAQVDAFLPLLPVVTGLRTPGMRDRHWHQLSERLGMTLKPDGKYTLTQVPRAYLKMVAQRGIGSNSDRLPGQSRRLQQLNVISIKIAACLVSSIRCYIGP